MKWRLIKLFTSGKWLNFNNFWSASSISAYYPIWKNVSCRSKIKSSDFYICRSLCVCVFAFLFWNKNENTSSLLRWQAILPKKWGCLKIALQSFSIKRQIQTNWAFLCSTIFHQNSVGIYNLFDSKVDTIYYAKKRKNDFAFVRRRSPIYLSS